MHIDDSAVVSQQPATQQPPADPPRLRSISRSDRIAIALAVIACVLVALTRWHRLHRVPRRPIVMTPAAALFMLGMIYLLAPIGSGLAMLIFNIRIPEIDAPPLTGDDLWKLQCGALLARLAGVIAFLVLLRSATPPLHDRRASPVAAIAFGFAGLLLVWPMVIASVSLTRWALGGSEDPISHDTLRELVAVPLASLGFWGWAMIVGVTIVGPLIEEVMYRGLLQDALGRVAGVWGTAGDNVGGAPWLAIVLTSVIFSLAHMTVVPAHGLVGLFVLSLGFGWAYERTGSLWAPFTMHALFNAGNLLLAQAAAPGP